MDNFHKLLWRAGFVVNIGKTIQIDKASACEFLLCSRRTLNRWLDTNDPCPRALYLLNMKNRCIPDTWKGFYFDRMDRLHWTGTQCGFDSSQIRMLPVFHSQKQRATNERDNINGLLDEIRDKDAHRMTKQKLLEISNMLHSVISDPIFTVLDNRRLG